MFKKPLVSLLIIGLSIMLTACNQGFTLDQEDLQLTVGDSITLTVQGMEPDELEWSSSDTGVAAVDQLGKVRAVGPGTAVITVRAEGKTATCNIQVTLELSLTSDRLWIGVRDTGKNAVRPIPPGETINWTSVDSGIAEVDQAGNIIGVAPGTTKVTASVGNVTAVCEVIVFSIEPVELLLVDGEESKLQVSYPPDGETIAWSVGDEGIAYIDPSGNVYAKSPGTTAVTANIAGGMSRCEVTVLGTAPDSLISKPGAVQQVQVYPLPPGESVVWSSEDESIAKVDQSGKVTAVGMGCTYITAQVAGKDVVCSVAVANVISNLKTASISGLISGIGSFSPDGNMFVSISSNNMGMIRCLMDFHGNEYELPRAPIASDFVGSGYGPVSWRGTKLVYSVSDSDRTVIYVYDTKDHTHAEITGGFNWGRYESAPQGLQPVFSSDNTVSVLLPDGVWSYSIDQQTWTQVLEVQADNVWVSKWSPDYKKLAWVDEGEGDARIVIVDIESGEKTLHEQNQVADFAWSEDGELAVASYQWDEKLRKIYYPLTILSQEGEVVKELVDPGNTFTNGGLGTTLSWVPGQNKVAYNTEDGLVFRDIGSGEKWLVLPPAPSPEMKASEWHQDGSWQVMQHNWLQNGSLAVSIHFGHIGRSLGVLEVYDIDWENWD